MASTPERRLCTCTGIGTCNYYCLCPVCRARFHAAGGTTASYIEYERSCGS
jgi:hypothetical protein